MSNFVSFTPGSRFLKSKNSCRKGENGVALILVLAFLVLISALVIAFFSSVTTELSGAKSYASGATTKQLADSTAQLVIGAISQATSGGTTVAWASQPGMIRTYNNSGNPQACYKLYSSDSMVLTGSGITFDPSSDLDSMWGGKPALYVDLNAPIVSGTRAHYPIIDGHNLKSTYAPSPQASGSLRAQTYFSSASANSPNPDIEGFWIITDPASQQGQVSYGNSIALDSGSTAPNPVPMPVRWLYMLQSGSMVSPVAVNGHNNQVTVAGASASDPIVGRVAFWTDDDTCKVNINTASEGNFSDIPRAQGVTDFNIANYPVIQKEYQRYPGHPATTCLSTVLGSLFPVDHTLQANCVSGANKYYTSLKPATYAPYVPYFDLAPRLNINQAGNLGSQAGTAMETGLNVKLSVKTDRLYASVDEFLFQPSMSGTARALNPPATSGTISINESILEEAKFFLTASSRAPDVNLFNQPRVLTWPISANSGTTYRTTFDRTFAFCGNIGLDSSQNPLAYYFQRDRNDHPTNDLPGTGSTTGLGRNRSLIGYLQNLTNQNIPGFGGNFAAKYPVVNGVSERDQILTEIFDYTRSLNLMDKSDPAMTHPFAPPALTANGYPTQYAKTNGLGTVTSASGTNAGSGQVVPIYDMMTQTKGFGRFPTISEVSLIFIATGWNDGKGGSATTTSGSLAPNYVTSTAGDNTAATPGTTGSTAIIVSGDNMTYAPWGYYNDGTNGFPVTSPTNAPGGVIPSGNIQVQAALLINFFDPSAGYVPEYNTHSVQITGLDKLQWGKDSDTLASMGFLATGTSIMPRFDDAGDSFLVTTWGGNRGFRFFWDGEGLGTAIGNYPFFSGYQNFPYDPENPSAPGTFSFKGGEIKIHILLPTNTPGWPVANWPLSSLPSGRVPLQTITISFPSTVATLPLPTYPQPAWNNKYLQSPKFQSRGNLGTRFASFSSQKLGANAYFIVKEDTVRSVRAYPGDIRMIAGKLTVTDSENSGAAAPGYFDSGETKIKNSDANMANWDYFSSSAHLVHSLRESVDEPFYGALLGQLVPGITYSKQPADGAPFTNFSYGLNNFCSAGNNATTAGAFIGGAAGSQPGSSFVSSGTLPGDWDNGFGWTADGPYINKADEGNLNRSSGAKTQVPYFAYTTYYGEASVTTFSPNRLIPSPVQFGSLPTGVVRNIPWQTLLFCPNPPAGNQHPGFGVPASGSQLGASALPPFKTPPDHLFLDLFTMPVVEPYPISEPLSTAGRINMNYQLAPFSYIIRNTGLRAVLKSERITVIPDAAAGAYKNGSTDNYPLNTTYDYRVPINIDETLKGFDYYFSNKDIFRSASQICDMFLYPARDAQLSSTSGPSWDSGNNNITTFWSTHRLTGDNSRERPYATIYPRLTTKSNTFTVHMRVQVLKKAYGTGASTWDETKDVVLSEYRGSQTIERYVDPADTKLPDFTTSTSASLDDYYKFRVLSTRKFSP